MIHKKDYTADYPNIQGLSEIHIFLEPLNPAAEIIKKYEDAVWCSFCFGSTFRSHLQVDEYNAVVMKPEESNKMKACVLCLNYRQAGDVTVLQSSRYFYSQDPQQVCYDSLEILDLVLLC
jgi:hypothetical protein